MLKLLLLLRLLLPLLLLLPTPLLQLLLCAPAPPRTKLPTRASPAPAAATTVEERALTPKLEATDSQMAMHLSLIHI